MTQLTDNTWYTSDYISPLQLFIRLTRGQLQPGKFWRKASFRRKFLIRSLVMPRATSQLLTNLTQWPELNTLLARQPRLPIRLHRPYMAVNIKRDFALDALCFHYQQMRQLLSREQQITGRGKRRPSRNYPAGDQSLPWSFSQTHRDGGSLSVCASLSGRKDYSCE